MKKYITAETFCVFRNRLVAFGVPESVRRRRIENVFERGVGELARQKLRRP